MRVITCGFLARGASSRTAPAPPASPSSSSSTATERGGSCAGTARDPPSDAPPDAAASASVALSPAPLAESDGASFPRVVDAREAARRRKSSTASLTAVERSNRPGFLSSTLRRVLAGPAPLPSCARPWASSARRRKDATASSATSKTVRSTSGCTSRATATRALAAETRRAGCRGMTEQQRLGEGRGGGGGGARRGGVAGGGGLVQEKKVPSVEVLHCAASCTPRPSAPTSRELSRQPPTRPMKTWEAAVHRPHQEPRLGD